MQTLSKLLRMNLSDAGLHAQGNRIPVAPGINVSWKRVGDVIVVSNDPAAGTVPDQTLADTQSYQDLSLIHISEPTRH